MQEKIGYPDYIMNDTALNADYEGVHVYAFNFLCTLNFDLYIKNMFLHNYSKTYVYFVFKFNLFVPNHALAEVH